MSERDPASSYEPPNVEQVDTGGEAIATDPGVVGSG
jgi:hypothetical protein